MNFTKEVLFMNKMTKEEIIEYFIDQLGDNKILEEIMYKYNNKDKR